MSKLFEFLPPTLFNPLAARGAPVYAQVLLQLFEASQQHYQPLSRELAVQLVAEVIADPEQRALTDADDDGTESAVEADPVMDRAAAVLRYLQRSGWLRSEMQSDFHQSYTLPDYAFRVLRALSDVAANEPPALRGLICAIHDLLQASVTEGSAHIRLPEAHRQTRHLLNGLKELQHNIGAHIEQVLRQYEARAVLEQLFLNYRSDIVDRAYHQLRTTDHVSRFRPAVLDAVAQLQMDDHVEASARRLYETKDAPSIESAASQLLDQLRDIREQFETLDRRLQAIDVRHSQFVDSAVRTVELHLTASSTTSGQLHAILSRCLSDEPAREKPLAADYDPLINLFQLELVDTDSLASPARAPQPFVPELVAPTSLTPTAIAAAREATLRHFRRAISHERVRRFAHELLRDREVIHGLEIPLAGPEELPLLMYLRAYGDGSLDYWVESLEDGAWIEHDGIGFRDFILRRV